MFNGSHWLKWYMCLKNFKSFHNFLLRNGELNVKHIEEKKFYFNFLLGKIMNG